MSVYQGRKTKCAPNYKCPEAERLWNRTTDIYNTAQRHVMEETGEVGEWWALYDEARQDYARHREGCSNE